jgi:hypothetical protein
MVLGACACAKEAEGGRQVELRPAVERLQTDATGDSGGVRVCTFRNGRLTEIEARIDSATGDTLVAGQPLASALPSAAPPFVGQTDWYRHFEPIIVDGRRYLTEGWPARRLRATELQYLSKYRGVPVFTEAGAAGRPEVVYLLVSPQCVFQPYPYMNNTGPVRG